MGNAALTTLVLAISMRVDLSHIDGVDYMLASQHQLRSTILGIAEDVHSHITHTNSDDVQGDWSYTDAVDGVEALAENLLVEIEKATVLRKWTNSRKPMACTS